jgi:Mg2+ and Co2+ transporter CorA
VSASLQDGRSFSNSIVKLYSVISQQDSLINRKDNKLNISIASSAKKDSIAMMTFTFITALFLPGTYISSLFSMTMFNWQTSASNPESHLSSYFWVYWVVTVPLTLLTLSGWHVWYRYADKEWQDTLNKIQVQVTKPVAEKAE